MDEKTTDKTEERTGGQITEPTEEVTEKRQANRRGEPTAESRLGQTGEPTANRWGKPAANRLQERSGERSAEQTNRRPADRAEKRPSGTAAGQRRERPKERNVSRTGSKAAVRTSGSAPAEPKRKKKRRRAGRKVLFFLLFMILAAAVGAVVYVLTPSRKQVDHREYFGLSDGVAYGLIVNQERAASYPVRRAGYWYLDFDTVHNSVSKKLYYDGESILYTNPTRTFAAKPDAYSYTDDDGLSYRLDYQPCYQENGCLYVALDYLKLLDYSYYMVDTERLYVWIWNNWSELPVAEAGKNGQVRYGSGIKKPIVDTVTAGETLIILEEGTNWVMVQTRRGLIGCIQKSLLKNQKTLTAETPDNRPLPVYTTRMLDETVCMAWHQVFNDSGYDDLDELLKHAEGLNVISPTWLTISDEQGNLKSLADKKYVDKAHKAGLQVWAMLDNINIQIDELQLFGVTAHRKHLIEEVMKEAERVGLDGINVDLEDVGSDNAEGLLQFLREMSAACRRNGLVMSVDNYSPMPHTAFYDREQQAEMVDYVIVMAYDEHYAGGETAGSTSSLSWVKQSAERTLAEVPKEKLIVGLPFYTRLWKETPEEYVDPDAKAELFVNENSRFGTYSLTSKGVGMDACDTIVKEHGLSMTWLEEEGQYYVEYEEDHSLYRLWIEDETSLDLKLDAAFSYDPAGVAFFKLGLENDDAWIYIGKYLK